MPNPKPGESKDKFIGRCIPYVKKEHPDWKQDKCVAVCYSLWRKKHPGSAPKKAYDYLLERLDELSKSLEDIQSNV